MELTGLSGAGVDGGELARALEEHGSREVPGYERLWSYYRNERTGSGGSRRCFAQAAGLPERLRVGRDARGDDRAGAPEVVLENDIGWRVDALIDFVFGKPLSIVSTARDASKRGEIERILDAVWESSGGIALLQDMGLLGAVHGHVDLILRVSGRLGAGGGSGVDAALSAAGMVRVELVDATRGVALLDPADYRRIRAYVVRTGGVVGGPRRTRGLVERVFGGREARLPEGERLEVLSASGRWVYEGGSVVEEGVNRLGFLPVVHVQNASQPMSYSGVSDVEPLIPLQDELNTRLSDRANRVTMQSFRMYLAKGLEGFADVPVAPGQVWSTDNPDASVESFGGDASSPSEQSHIDDLRDAMDKVSSVSPVALGVIRARLGHLSSENALRITLMGVLSKTARKRLTYGRGIARMSEMVLGALDAAGVYETEEADRTVRVEWPDPLPLDERDRLRSAQMKVDLGVPLDRVLAELGYVGEDAGVV